VQWPGPYLALSRGEGQDIWHPGSWLHDGYCSSLWHPLCVPGAQTIVG
jgi:hypothetical protein